MEKTLKLRDEGKAEGKADRPLPRSKAAVCSDTGSRRRGAEGAHLPSPICPREAASSHVAKRERVVRGGLQVGPQTRELLGGVCHNCQPAGGREQTLALACSAGDPHGEPGTYRCAEVAAARTALVLHHPAPVVFTQHQEWRFAGRAH